MSVYAGKVVLPASVTSVKPVKFGCMLCGKKFHGGEARAYQNHVARCANEHEEDIAVASPKNDPIFGDQGWDTEYEQWVKRHGRM